MQPDGDIDARLAQKFCDCGVTMALHVSKDQNLGGLGRELAYRFV
jgi:hypothetical protein